MNKYVSSIFNEENNYKIFNQKKAATFNTLPLSLSHSLFLSLSFSLPPISFVIFLVR